MLRTGVAWSMGNKSHRLLFTLPAYIDCAGVSAEVIRYVNDMQLYFRLIPARGGRVYTPYIKLSYSHQLDADVNENSTVSVCQNIFLSYINMPSIRILLFESKLVF